MITVIPRGFTVSDVETITASGGIDATHTLMRVVSSGGDVNITADPQITPGNLDGQRLYVQGTSDTNKVILDNGDGLSMSVSITLGDKDVIFFLWNSTESLWVMITSDTK